MFRVLLLILIVMSSFAFAQTDEKPKALKLDEFERTSDEDVRARIDVFFIDLNNNPTAEGYLISFGTAKEIALRTKQILASIKFRKYDPQRITLVNGGFSGIMKTECWIVPAGAENPKPESTAKKLTEFGKATSGEIKRDLDFFYIELNSNPDYQGYIVNFGSTKAVTAREKEIIRFATFRKYDLSRIKFMVLPRF